MTSKKLRDSSKSKPKKLFRYSGNKEWFIEYANEIIDKDPREFESYFELFLGSGALFLNLNRKFDCYFINDKDPWICLIWEALGCYSYSAYQKALENIRNNFGDIKKDKAAYYNFRDCWNTEFAAKVIQQNFKVVNYKAGLYLLILASACLNSMLRFGPNGMNQSFGNRSYEISEKQWNLMQNRVRCKTTFSNEDFLIFEPELIKNSVLFLDPPYVNREMTYNKNGFDFNKFIDWVKRLDSSNLILYTDFENPISDKLVDDGFKKIEIRTMKSTSPNRKQGVEETGKEILYLK